MKKALRILLRSLIVLAALSLVVLFSCLDRVDTRPYFREPYYGETVARLKTMIATNGVTRGELSAGFGRARLTPTVNVAADNPEEGQFRSLPLAGYGNRDGKPATGVHDDLYVKAVALKVGDRMGVMLGADALIIPPEVAAMAARQLQKELGLTREQLYLSATHTHSSLGGWGEGMVAEAFAGGYQPGARVWFAHCLVAAVREAIADLKPAQWGHGRFVAPEYIRNRVVGSLGGVDPEFSYALLRQSGGKLAVLGAYGAHATTLSSGQMEFSADYPGCWQRAIEKETGGLAVFLAGDVASQSPVPGENGYAGSERMGQALARAILDRIPQTPLTNTVTLGMLGLDVTLPPFNARLTDDLRLRPWLAKKILPAVGHSFLQVFRLDNSLWVSTPCDFSGELALGIKDSFRVRGNDVTVTSFNGDYVGYVILPRYYHLDGYEPRTMSFFGPYVPDYFDELIRKMATSLAAK
ncbi:MAG TPA: neutral/alkaline non-lysosomal ceramidase N-terminal domain-containing protein [Candidatus Limnocylindria bacterium]|nr:neutral/alkaline non-lysosomal ceramidase N-terminal domain-containing protein [Candidatus Limnocylindria bacterium]